MNVIKSNLSHYIINFYQLEYEHYRFFLYIFTKPYIGIRKFDIYITMTNRWRLHKGNV